MEHPQEKFMQAAIQEAKDSASLGQYALGAVIVDTEGNILAVEHTTLHETNDPTCHAEINTIRSACKRINSRYLTGCWLYTTLEPCPMCTSAAIWAKMEGIVFGASKEDAQEFGKDLRDTNFTWRQIDISAKDIIAKGDPTLGIVEKYMQDECIQLFNLSKN